MSSEDQIDEKYIETLLINGKEVSRRKGTIEEIHDKAKKDEHILEPSYFSVPELPIPDITMIASKLTWEIIKSGKPTIDADDSALHVFSKKDSNWTNYVNSKKGESDKIQWKLDNLFGINCFDVIFKIITNYGAENPNVGGKWIPSTYVHFLKCSSRWPWNIEGKASVSPIINDGTSNEPIPVFTLTVNLAANQGIITKRMLSYQFNIDGDKGIERIEDEFLNL
ncbi:hypothetical protein [Methanococcoides sp. LMO-2]|uniref:Uncharacterized protein n=1 Tax=Methanococcoides cohabitans TaxID=3136559 RepID=A0ABU9KRS0_9EURY